MTLVEGIATLFGLACVWLTVKQNIWCWPAGLVQVILYIYIFYEVQLYSDMLLHIVFVFINVYGWYLWSHAPTDHKPLEVSLVGKALAFWLILCLIGTVALGYGMGQFTDASLPYPDAFIAVASLIAQWLMAKKKLESWWFWIVVDVVAIGVYWTKGLHLTTGLYTVFLFLAISGYFEWRKTTVQVKPISGAIR